MTKQKEIDWRIVVVGLACLTTIEMFALSKGINGTMLSIVIAIVAGVIGVTIPNPFKK